MAHQSFAQRVLGMLREVCREGGKADAGEMSSRLLLQTRKEHKRMLNTLSDLARQGRIVRVSQGVYAEAKPAAEADKREVMWRLLKMRRRVTVDDLVEMAGVSRDYAREWLLILVRREVARKIQEPGKAGLWVLINDTAEMPLDENKAARLRGIRLKKKQVISKLDAIDTALGDIRQILKTMEEEQ